MSTNEVREERIRQHAFMLWNAEGRPEGKEQEHWRQAEKVIDEMDRQADAEARRGDL